MKRKKIIIFVLLIGLFIHIALFLTSNVKAVTYDLDLDEDDTFEWEVTELNPHQFEKEALLKKISHLSKKYNLFVSIFDFVDFSEKYQDEERLLKREIKEWGLNNDLKAIPIDLPEELYFIVKNIYLHSKKEYEVA